MPDPKLASSGLDLVWASGRASQPASAHSYQDCPLAARLQLGAQDAREKLLQDDARFQIKGKVHDSRELAWHPEARPPPQVADAGEKLFKGVPLLPS